MCIVVDVGIFCIRSTYDACCVVMLCSDCLEANPAEWDADPANIYFVKRPVVNLHHCITLCWEHTVGAHLCAIIDYDATATQARCTTYYYRSGTKPITVTTGKTRIYLDRGCLKR